MDSIIPEFYFCCSKAEATHYFTALLSKDNLFWEYTVDNLIRKSILSSYSLPELYS